jgi:NAD(P)-dependent dehydrogenase (short-subunit alcohol dehydrogenase family)
VATILITGASRGIGAAFAKEMVKKNCTLLLQYRSDQKNIEQLSKECAARQANVVPIQGDFSSQANTLKFVENVQVYDPECLVLCHGPYIEKGLEQLSFAEMSQAFQENVFSQVQICQGLLSSLKKKKGRVLFVGMTNLSRGSLQSPAYLAAKAALASFMRSFAKLLAPYQVPVNMLCPGYCENSVVHPKSLDSIPMGHAVSIEEVAKALAQLYTAPRYQTGNCIEISGGLHL